MILSIYHLLAELAWELQIMDYFLFFGIILYSLHIDYLYYNLSWFDSHRLRFYWPTNSVIVVNIHQFQSYIIFMS